MGRLGSCLITLFVIAGCASTSSHVPTAVPIAENTTPLNDFRASGGVALVNTASDPDNRTWTASVITFLSEQLVQRGAKVDESASRKLSLQVVKAEKFSAASWLTLAAPEGCQITVRVETGTGYVHEYFEERSAYFWQKACDKGVTGAVVDMLNDANVREYLELTGP